MQRPTAPPHIDSRRWIRLGAGALCGLASAELLAGLVVANAHWERLDPLAVDPAPPTALSHVFAGAGVIGLSVLARGLARGTRRAAGFAIVLLTSAIAIGLLGHARPGLLATEIAACALLALRLDAFPRGTAVRPPRLAGALVAGATGVAYGLAVAAVLNSDPPSPVGAELERAGAWLLAGSWWLHDAAPVGIALHAVVGVTVLGAAWWLHALLRPGAARSGHTPSDHARAASIVAAHAADSLDPFALREDKSFFFAHDGLLAYRTLRETAIVAGDPIGPPGSAPAILAAFEAEAAGRGWDVVLTAAARRHLDGYHALGLRSMAIGEEGVVDPARFSLDGPAMKTVRKAVNRVARHGWTIEVLRAGELPPLAIADIGDLEREWRSQRPRIIGFAMTLGRLWGATEDQDAIYVIGRDADGVVRAFLRFDRYADGLSLDIMRRSCNEPNGINEALIAAAIAHAREESMARVSLNFAGFSHLLRADAVLTRRQTLGRRALRLAHGRFQLEQLARFNEKFGVTWEPRHLVYRRRLGVPRATLRILQAEAYVRPPRAVPLAGRWRPAPVPVGAPLRVPGAVP